MSFKCQFVTLCPRRPISSNEDCSLHNYWLNHDDNSSEYAITLRNQTEEAIGFIQREFIMLTGLFGEQTMELRMDISGFDLFSKYNLKNMKFGIPSSPFACLSIFLNSSNLLTRRERASVTMIILSLTRIWTTQKTQSIVVLHD